MNNVEFSQLERMDTLPKLPKTDSDVVMIDGSGYSIKSVYL